jgi:hypothetical protein
MFRLLFMAPSSGSVNTQTRMRTYNADFFCKWQNINLEYAVKTLMHRDIVKLY